jgi:hypothetical protein
MSAIEASLQKAYMRGTAIRGAAMFLLYPAAVVIGGLIGTFAVFGLFALLGDPGDPPEYHY